MIGRKNAGQTSPLLLVVLALAFFIVTYNFLTMIMHYKSFYSENLTADGVETADPEDKTGNPHLKYHVALTATDSSYSQWQSRIMYYWYQKMKDVPGSDMGKFTRILHSGKADKLMEEIPTFVVDPLPEGLDRVRFFNHLHITREFLVWIAVPYPFDKMSAQSCFAVLPLSRN